MLRHLRVLKRNVFAFAVADRWKAIWGYLPCSVRAVPCGLGILDEALVPQGARTCQQFQRN